MITLYSYPELFGVADNNGYGLKVFAFLRLNGMPFKHEHVFDASAAPRGQLPYIVDDGETIGDSDTIIAHVIAKNRLKIDAALTAGQRDMSLLITRMLDDLYWVGMLRAQLFGPGGNTTLEYWIDGRDAGC
jgi:glutathione S-transferase